MFKKHKLEIKLVKNRDDESLIDATPSINKEDVLHVAKQVVKYVVGGVLIGMTAAASLDTAKFAAMSKIEHKYDKSED